MLACLHACAGMGMKVAVYHLMSKGPEGRATFFARQGSSRTVVLLGTDADGSASVTYLPIPPAFVERPGQGKVDDLVSHAAEELKVRRTVWCTLHMAQNTC